MIPTFNCAGYLRQTLESVLRQCPGPEEMQIEVVDDCSTKDDPESVVREIGRERVLFFRQPANVGAIHNFNTCIARSRGELVHILHGDDLVLPGFYQRFTEVARSMPDAALIACRALFIDECGIIFGVSDRVRHLEAGGRDVGGLLYENPLHTPGVVIRRTFYEQHGGFVPTLVHAADWEMWARAIGDGGGVVLPDVLCEYRVFGANDTARLKRTAENLRDVDRLFELQAFRHADFDRRRALQRVAHEAELQMHRFLRGGDAEAYRANAAYYRGRVPLPERGRRWLRAACQRVIRGLLG